MTEIETELQSINDYIQDNVNDIMEILDRLERIEEKLGIKNNEPKPDRWKSVKYD